MVLVLMAAVPVLETFSGAPIRTLIILCVKALVVTTAAAAAGCDPLRAHAVVAVFPGDADDLARNAAVRDRLELFAVSARTIPVAIAVDVPKGSDTIGIVVTDRRR